MSSRKQIKLIKQINKALKNPHLYNDEELITLKQKRAKFLDLQRRFNLEQQGGFGN
tara:strand:- start:857 stop:1024 length:168 start_codon:yes stop_codon:yes gene_type:complete